MSEIKIPQHQISNAAITKINEYIESSVQRFQDGEVLDNETQAVALNNIIIINNNQYGLEEDEWVRLKNCGVSSEPLGLTEVEKQVIAASLTKKFSYKHTAETETQLEEGTSKNVEVILEVLKNLREIKHTSYDEEDVLLTTVVDILIMPFLKFDDCIVHGNGHALQESYTRKVATAKKHGLSSQKFEVGHPIVQLKSR